jgi:hypothetical protein
MKHTHTHTHTHTRHTHTHKHTHTNTHTHTQSPVCDCKKEQDKFWNAIIFHNFMFANERIKDTILVCHWGGYRFFFLLIFLKQCYGWTTTIIIRHTAVSQLSYSSFQRQHNGKYSIEHPYNTAYYNSSLNRKNYTCMYVIFFYLFFFCFVIEACELESFWNKKLVSIIKKRIITIKKMLYVHYIWILYVAKF